MRPFRSTGTRALALSVIALLAFAAPPGAQTGVQTGAQSNDAALAGLSSAQRARLADAEGLSRAVADGGRVRVIVSFELPALPAGVLSGSADADAAVTAAVRAGQEAILGRVLPAAGLRGALNGLLAGTPGQDETAIRLFNYNGAFALNADAELLRRLAEDPQVSQIVADGIARPLLNTYSTALIGVPAAFDAGATGSGRTVAVLDTGARSSHQFLSSRIVAGACFSTSTSSTVYTSYSLCPGGQPTGTGIAAGNDCAESIEGCGHGTHVTGIVAGNYANNAGNPAYGVARNANILSIQVFSRFDYPASCDGACALSFDSDQLAALEYVYDQRTRLSIAAVNMSLGGGIYSAPCTSNLLRPIVQQLTDAGIAVVIAAGNDGYNGSVNSPACIPEAITVGSTDRSDARSVFRRGGSNWSDQLDLAAPGSAIRSAVINGNSNNSYDLMSGTSMAAPHVAGAFAALRSARPNDSVAQLLSALQSTGTGVSSNGVTVPRINLDRALSQLNGSGAIITTLELTQSASQAPSGTQITFTARLQPSRGTAPSGQITFRANGVTMGTAALSGGVARFSQSLAAGTHTISASYAGNAEFGASTASLTHVATVVAPPNDNFANRITLTGPGTITTSTVGATTEAGEPQLHEGVTSHSTLWWSYTAPRDGRLVLSTAGSSFDTVLGVFTGSGFTNLRPIASNDDAPNANLTSRVEFDATAGTTYQIGVGGYLNATGSLTLALGFTPAASADYTPLLTLTSPETAVQHQVVELYARAHSTLGRPQGMVVFSLNGSEIGRSTIDGGDWAYLQYPVTTTGTHRFVAEYLGLDPFLPATSTAAVTEVSANDHDGIFAGGGVLWGFYGNCAGAGWAGGPVPVRVRYTAGEIVGRPTHLSLILPSGAEYITTWAPYSVVGSFQDGFGRRIWRDVQYYSSSQGPTVRVDSREIIRPAGGSNIRNAQELNLRVRVRNFSNQPDCNVRVSATVRRDGS